MTIAEDGCGDRDDVVEDSLCRIATAVDLRLHFFDNDAFASFNRFHITEISDAVSGFYGIPVADNLRVPEPEFPVGVLNKK